MASKPLTPAQKAAAKATADLAKQAQGLGIVLPAIVPTNTGHPNVDKVINQQTIRQLDTASATTLLQQAMASSQYAGKITPQLVQEFVKNFNADAVKQARTVAGVVQTRLTQKAPTPDDIARETSNVIATQFPDYLNPRVSASNFIWSKINFKDKTAGANAIKSLQDVKSIANSYGPNSMAPAVIEQYALKVAQGKMSLDDFKGVMQPIGAQNYPQFADALRLHPTLSVYDIAGGYINQMAKTLEMDPNLIKLDNPLLDRALRPDGTAGKLPAQSLPDFNRALMDTPQWENTTAANDSARQAATGLAHAMGMGV